MTATDGVGSAAIITPTHSGDVERTRLLVDSYRRTSTQLPLFLIAHTEDRDLFADLRGSGVELLTTADVLPDRVERRRRNRYRRRDPRRYVEGKPLHGWTSQQLVKLAAPSVIGTDIVFCVDSDVLLLQPLELDHGRNADHAPLIFESSDDNALTMSWAIKSMELLGVDLRDAVLRQYTHQGVCLHRATCERLRDYLEERTSTAWWQVFLREGLAEYQTYGVFARDVDKQSPLVPAPPLDILTYWTDPGDILQRVVGEIRARAPLGVCIQSNLGIPAADISAALAPLWS